MQVIAVAPPGSRSERVAVARSAVAAVLLIVAGLLLAWVCVGTPIVNSLMPSGRPTALQIAVGIFAWGFAIVVPAGLMLIGIARIAATIESLSALQPPALAPRLASALGPDHLAATNLLLPGGRRIHELVLGPFGIVVIGDVPPRPFSRHVGSRWEVRGRRGRWIPIEGPIERAVRDAERVRGWLAVDERDFLVRVMPVVISDDERVQRTPECPVVGSHELGAWLEALPVQRGLTPDRRDRLVEQIREIAQPR